MLCRLTSNFVGLVIAFMYSKIIVKISIRGNILFKAVLTSYQIDNVIRSTMKDPPYIISSVGDTACEITRTY